MKNDLVVLRRRKQKLQEKTQQIEKIANHESRIDTLERNDLEQVEKIKGLIPKCPRGKTFQFINGKCYLVDL